MKKGLFVCLALLATPLASHAQYPPMYGGYPQYRPVVPYGYPMFGPPSQGMMPTMPAAQPIPGYQGPRATPAQPTQMPAPTVDGDAATFPSFDSDVLGAPPVPVPETPVGDMLNPRLRRPDRFWISGEYTPVFIRSGPLGIPLVTTGPTTPNAADRPGALGLPGTTVLFGDDDLQWGRLDGFRGGAGIWFDTESHLGMELRGTWITQQSVRFFAASDAAGNTVLARPIFATNSKPGTPPQEVVSLAAFSPDQVGSIRVTAPTEYRDLELNIRLQDFFSPVTRGSWIFGFRTARLEEALAIQSNTKMLRSGTGNTYRKDTPLLAGDSLGVEDRFETINQFYGMQAGGLWALDLDRFFLEVHGKAAVGVTHERTQINGSTTYTPAVGRSDVSVGGLLAQTSNIGTYNRYMFGILPEAGVNLGVNVMECLRIKGGYSCMFWSGVTRPGLAIDRRVDLTQVPSSNQFQTDFPGTPAPLFNFRDQLFWMHVFNVGLEYHY